MTKEIAVNTNEKPVVSKATKGASLKKLERIANEMCEKARKDNPNLVYLEEHAQANIEEIRMLVGTTPNGNRSVFGHMMHGMSGRLDMALMKYDPTNFAAIMCEVASGDNRARRSKSNDHIKCIGHALDTLKRVSGNGVNSADKFSKTLASIGMNHKTEYICNLMAPVSLLFHTYAQSE